MEKNEIEKLTELVNLLKEEQRHGKYSDVNVLFYPEKKRVVLVRAFVGMMFLKWLISLCESLDLYFFMDISNEVPQRFMINCYSD